MPARLTDSPTEELKDTQDPVWQTDSLVGRGSVSVKCLERRQHHVESWPSLTLSLAQRSTSCPRVESWLTKHSGLFGLALMDFDDRTDMGNTLNLLVALKVKHPTDVLQRVGWNVILKKKTEKSWVTTWDSSPFTRSLTAYYCQLQLSTPPEAERQTSPQALQPDPVNIHKTCEVARYHCHEYGWVW